MGQRVLLVGGSGTIGRATARALVAAGHTVIALLRPGAQVTLPGCTVLTGEVTDPQVLHRVMTTARPDAVVSCLASRTGAPDDARRVDRDANSALLRAALVAGVTRFVLL